MKKTEAIIPRLEEGQEAHIVMKADGTMSVMVIDASKARLSVGVARQRKILGRCICTKPTGLDSLTLSWLPPGEWEIVAERIK